MAGNSERHRRKVVNMNKTQITGNIAQDLMVKNQEGGKIVVRTSVATRRRLSKEQREREDVQTADFIPIVAFGHTAEFLNKYFKKGSGIEVTGRLQSGSYTNKEGVKVYTLDLVAEEISFPAGGSKTSDNASNSGGVDASAPVEDDDGFMNIPDGLDEELPFN